MAAMLRRLSSFYVTGVRGLQNHHSCCCVNTLLQALSATWELADLLDRWDPSRVEDDVGSVPLQLRRALTAMQRERSQPYPHRDFLRCLHENNIPLSVQHDANEVLLCILNLIRKQMDDEALALDIQNLFKISTETQVQCSVCSNVQRRSSYLLSLSLPIRAQENSLESCVESFFESQMLNGRDQCFCVQCETKTPSKQGTKLLSLPKILCVHLSRAWNSGYTVQKLDRRVAFPEFLDFSGNLGEIFSTDFSQQVTKYILYAVVVHAGSTMCGHYTAFVRPKDDNSWYYADDSHVERATWEEVQRTYGGRGRYSGSAYVLMYRRISEEEGEKPECSG